MLVCGKCGKAKKRNGALQDGWLEHQIKNAPDGYLIIRCPEHTTGHALRIAGLPQQITSKRVADNIERGLWYQNDRLLFSVGEQQDDNDNADGYYLSYHRGEMPAYHTEPYATLKALIQAMRTIEPDLRKWKLT